MASTFLTAEWRKLIMANYVVAEELLQTYLPVGTELDRNELQVRAAVLPQAIATNSAEEFFTEHYWGYSKRGVWTSEYEVLHPRWTIYPVLQHSINVDFGALYGSEFASLSERGPESVLLAEGSEIEVRSGERIATAC
jgi:hypothetical protein